MEFIAGLSEHLLSDRPTALTFGNFDGVHLGHQALLKKLRLEANLHHLPVSIVLFEPQPGEFFRKDQPTPRLTSLRDKINVLSKQGVDRIYCLKFNHIFSLKSSTAFVRDVLFKQLQAETILVGADAHFGHGRTGDVALLSQLAQEMGKTVCIFPNHEIQGERISSTFIRQALSQGNLAYASQCLGRPYSVMGRVTYGAGLGRQLGFPTANLHIRYPVPPLQGVFAVQLTLPEEKVLEGIANWGVRPSLSSINKPILEVHALNTDENLYGKWVEVRFLKKIREEMKFASLDALVAQIHRDIEEVRNYFGVGALT